MFKKKVRWYQIFENEESLQEGFLNKNSKLYKGLFGEAILIRSNGSYYAYKNKCPHQNKSLEGCKVEDDAIVCPFHSYKFSLNDGRGHGLCLDKYQFKVTSEGVFLGKEGWSLF